MTTPPDRAHAASVIGAAPRSTRRWWLVAAANGLLTTIGIAVAVARPAALADPLRDAGADSTVAAAAVLAAVCLGAVAVHLSPLVVPMSFAVLQTPVAAAVAFAATACGALLTSHVTSARHTDRGDALPAGVRDWMARRPLLGGIAARQALVAGPLVEPLLAAALSRRSTYLASTVVGLAVWTINLLIAVTVLRSGAIPPAVLGVAGAAPLLVVFLVPLLRRRRA